MLVRTVSAHAVPAIAALGLIGLTGAAPVMARPIMAQPSVTPASVLAAKATSKGARGFADRTARLTSIMGPEIGAAAPLHVPTKPSWQRPLHREADATAGTR